MLIAQITIGKLYGVWSVVKPTTLFVSISFVLGCLRVFCLFGIRLNNESFSHNPL